MLSKFVNSNTASTLGTLPSNTVTNPKEDLKGITTRSGVAYKGPTIHTTSFSKVAVNAQLLVLQRPNKRHTDSNFLQKKMMKDFKVVVKANDQIEKFYEIFRDLSFGISLRMLDAYAKIRLDYKKPLIGDRSISESVSVSLKTSMWRWKVQFPAIS
ncbi:hypothetical protein Tco_1219818 [Tanacetum coccineum]